MGVDFVAASSHYLTSGISSDFNLSGDFTVNIWFAADAYANTPYMFDFTAANNTLALYLSAGGAVGAYRNAGINITGGSVTFQKWHMYTLSRISGTMYLYLDGGQVNSDADAGDINAGNTGVRIGVNGGVTSNFYDGKFGLIELYNGTGLTQADITDKYYARGNSLNITNRVLRLTMMEKSATVNVGANDIKDESPNQHVITATNTPTYTGVPLNFNQ